MTAPATAPAPVFVPARGRIVFPEARSTLPSALTPERPVLPAPAPPILTPTGEQLTRVGPTIFHPNGSVCHQTGTTIFCN